MNFAEFIAMGGYAKFVWGAYGVTFTVLAIHLIFTIRGLKKSQQTLRQFQSNEQAPNAKNTDEN